MDELKLNIEDIFPAVHVLSFVRHGFRTICYREFYPLALVSDVGAICEAR